MVELTYEFLREVSYDVGKVKLNLTELDLPIIEHIAMIQALSTVEQSLQRYAENMKDTHGGYEPGYRFEQFETQKSKSQMRKDINY